MSSVLRCKCNIGSKILDQYNEGFIKNYKKKGMKDKERKKG